MLTSAVIGGIGVKGKGRERDSETRFAAVQCLAALVHERAEADCPPFVSEGAHSRLLKFQSEAREATFTPVLGQTINSLLHLSETRYLALQHASLDLLRCILQTYAQDAFVPSILPGVVSTMCKVLLDVKVGKGWANGETVARALHVMQIAIIRSIGDDVCAAEGVIRRVDDLEHLTDWDRQPSDPTDGPRPHQTLRTASWLRATSSQLHIAINSLSPLVSHPTASALHGLSSFSASVIEATALTLPQTQPLLLSFLLSLSNAIFPRVASSSRDALLSMLTTPSFIQVHVVQTLARITKDNLSALPRLIPSMSDSKVTHVASLIAAVCNLGSPNSISHGGIPVISSEIGKLLGPAGGIEKWGWSLLSVLELTEVYHALVEPSVVPLTLEGDTEAIRQIPFPDLTFKHINSRDTVLALEQMMNSLGRAGGDGCLYAVEWFVKIGQSDTRSRSVTALWCACRLLEGVVGISLSAGTLPDLQRERKGKRLEKFARTLSRGIAELWELGEDPPDSHKAADDHPHDGDIVSIQLGRGLGAVSDTLNIIRPASNQLPKTTLQPIIHRALALQLISACAAILGARFSSSFIFTLYPVLHSLVSAVGFLSSTASAALNYITAVTSYASPANLLLSNFDYALDSISRRLTRRWLDVDATQVLTILIRLVGSDVVNRAGDVVEECFDRLDDFHGYAVIVEGLVEVLLEVVKVIEADALEVPPSIDAAVPPKEVGSIDSFLSWLAASKALDDIEKDTTDYGPAPREAWGKGKGKEVEGAEDAEDAEEQGNGEAGTQAIDTDPPLTPIQALTKQIVSRSIFFLTHGAPAIRARILVLLSSSVPVLSESALLPSIHSAWPFILNRLSDSEPYVISATAGLVEALTTHVGTFMYRRIWDDVWPRFEKLLRALDAADSISALARRGPGAVGTESAYTHSHKLYRSILSTMTATIKGVQPQDSSLWQVILAFRRFLHRNAHEELQKCARDLYLAIGRRNADAVWLALTSTTPDAAPAMRFLENDRWDIGGNVDIIVLGMDGEK
ncbi:hypothetical protein BDN72DRAFT_830534 [Pluteus cervinus]|uniref:Uncharacterized protein n=1 Tax=Pluteus cervinus TaxID=181527 RepID=A0ACD3BIC6_9AGAR|nr:hypothetical protein BDN72DRAFT_830534 [Pluteus cervinus]